MIVSLTYLYMEVRKMKETIVNVIGAGLAGSEAAWQLAKRGIKYIYMKCVLLNKHQPIIRINLLSLFVPIHFAANTLTNAVGVLKEEMRMLDSVIIRAADACAVPAGGALAVDRHEFAARVTDLVKNHPNVTVVNEEVTEIPEGPTVIATGPLQVKLIGKLKGNHGGRIFLLL